MLTRRVVAVCATVLISVAPAAASTITLDFQTAATGLNIVAVPLVTSIGTITASATAGSDIFQVLAGQGGFATNALLHQQNAADDTDYGQLAFSFNVASIQFQYSGNGAGVFTGQALDAGLNVIDSFFDPDTTTDLPGGFVTLTAPGIRFFRFFDAPGGAQTVIIDNVTITGEVPEPATMVLLASGLAAGLARRRARRA